MPYEVKRKMHDKFNLNDLTSAYEYVYWLRCSYLKLQVGDIEYFASIGHSNLTFKLGVVPTCTI